MFGLVDPGAEGVLPMSDNGTKDLHQLARRYYIGELSYESYRSERTQLLDRLTRHAGNDDMNLSVTQLMSDKTRVIQAPSSRRHRMIWVLIAVLIAIVAMIWVMKSGWITISSAPMEHGAITVPAITPDINSNNQTEKVRYLNG